MALSADERRAAEEKRESDKRAAEAKILKAKVAGSKSWLTRAVNEAEAAVGRCGTKPNDSQAICLQKCSTELDTRYWGLKDVMVAYQDVCQDEAEIADIGTYADAALVSYNKLKEDVDKLLSEHAETSKQTRAIVPGQSGSGSGSGASNYQNQMRVISDLKPKTLCADSLPEEMRQWSEKFKSYHEASNMSQSNCKTQQAFLKATVDSDINGLLENEITDETSVEDCIAALERMFLRKYPVFTRRWHIFDFKQNKSDSYTTFYSKLK